ncbi:MAG: sodium:solute symporter, partial [Lachnospiraceae bacterium]|nr:sodium:solute symporter [Lachnospiraceae bacterium]
AILASPINCGAFCMIAGLIIVPVVSAFTKKPDATLVEDAFRSYSQKVLVEQKTALGEENN